MAKKEKRARITKASVRRWLNIPNSERIYFVLQFVFWALEFALLLLCVQGINPLIPVIYGALLLLISLKSQHTACRVLIRVISAAVIGLTAVMIVGFCLTAQDTTGVVPMALSVKERIGFGISYVITVMGPLLLATIPAYIVSAHLGKVKADSVLLHIGSWICILLAAGTLYLNYDPTIIGHLLQFGSFSFFFFTLDVLLWIYVIAAVALAFAVFMLYPFGVKRIKGAVEAARAKLPQNEE